MAIDAYKSRRVAESLRAIEAYLEQAAKLADAVKPSDTLKLDIEDPPVVAVAEVTAVTWDATNSKVIALSRVGNEPSITVYGENLTHQEEDDNGNLVWVESITSLKLIGPDASGAYFNATDFHDADEGELTADLELVAGREPQTGSYEVLAVSGGGDVHFLSDACSITAAAKDDPVRSGFELVAMVPNQLQEGSNDVALFISGGKAKDLKVTDLNGDDVAGFAIDNKKWGTGHGLTMGRLTIEVAVKEGAFYLVATANQSAAEDKLLFVVAPRRS